MNTNNNKLAGTSKKKKIIFEANPLLSACSDENNVVYKFETNFQKKHC